MEAPHLNPTAFFDDLVLRDLASALTYRDALAKIVTTDLLEQFKVARDASRLAHFENFYTCKGLVVLPSKREKGCTDCRRERVFAVGPTPGDAIRALAIAKDWGEVKMGAQLDGGEQTDRFDWGLRFTAGGTGFKAAGYHLPGGCVITWWS
jgi:hypothetical protein